MPSSCLATSTCLLGYRWLYDGGKPKADIMREYDIGKSTLDRWMKRIHDSGSTRAADNRTPEQAGLVELERENKRLRMEVDVLEQAARGKPARETPRAGFPRFSCTKQPVSLSCRAPSSPWWRHVAKALPPTPIR